jgi:hypothetical protein
VATKYISGLVRIIETVGMAYPFTALFPNRKTYDLLKHVGVFVSWCRNAVMADETPTRWIHMAEANDLNVDLFQRSEPSLSEKGPK